MHERSQRWVSRWQWTVWAGMVVLALFIPILGSAAEPAERTYRIHASQFAYSPAVLSVNPGDQVTIELVATDVVHGISIDGYELEAVSNPGQSARLTFIAERQGSFRFRCTVTCGNMHPFMIGKLQVGTNSLFWRAASLAGLALLAAVWTVQR